MDAILAYDEAGRPVEPEWPAAEVIIGNPPFLGGKRLRSELGDEYVDDVFRVYDGRVPREADLVCYWFEKARGAIATDYANRSGLLATNSIRGGANRKVLERIKSTGDIFVAWSDNPWILDGAAVRVSIIGFDSGETSNRILDGGHVQSINPDLTARLDLTDAFRLKENQTIAFMGDTKGGEFDIDEAVAHKILSDDSNLSGLPNIDVVKPWVNSSDITGRRRRMWIIDFGTASEEMASRYVLPFQFVQERVKPFRLTNRRDSYRERWWIHMEPRPAMWERIGQLKRYIVTPTVAKHRIFVWLEHPTVPDHQLIVFARDDDYFFGVLHSRPHELWALRMGTWLGVGNDPRYTPTTTFETFPFPWPPGQEPRLPDHHVADIAPWARALAAWREAWLNPPPPAKGTLDVAYDRLIKVRTLTNLYNGLAYWRATRPFDRAAFDKETRKSVTPAEIQELDDIHRALDAAVLRAYGWPADLPDEAILERLLALNLARAVALQT